MKNLIQRLFKKRSAREEPTKKRPFKAAAVHDDNGMLIQIESGWPDEDYALFLGESIVRLRLLIGELTFNPAGQERLIQSTLTTALLAGRLTDNKVLDCLVDGGDRIRSGKVQKSITVLATIICYVAEQLAKVEITTPGKPKWMYVEPFSAYIDNGPYEIVYKDSRSAQERDLRGKLTNVLVGSQTIEHLVGCGVNYTNVFFNLVTVRDYQPLSGPIVDAINRNRIGQLSPSKQKKKSKGNRKSQLVELITQVIKNGRANQPGSKIWSSETSVYFLFPQAANDIRALAKTYQVETPKETLDLVQLLADSKLIEIPPHPANPKLPFYKKISITSQGVPKKPQVAVELSKSLHLHDTLELDNVDIVEVGVEQPKETEKTIGEGKAQVAEHPTEPVKLKQVEKPKGEKKEQPSTPIEKLVANIKKSSPERITDDVVVVTLGEIKKVANDPMKYINKLLQSGEASDFNVNAKAPNDSEVTINIDEINA